MKRSFQPFIHKRAIERGEWEAKVDRNLTPPTPRRANRCSVTPCPASRTRKDRLKAEPRAGQSRARESLAWHDGSSSIVVGFSSLPGCTVTPFVPPFNLQLCSFLLSYFSARIPAGFPPTLTEQKNVRARGTD